MSTQLNCYRDNEQFNLTSINTMKVSLKDLSKECFYYM